MTRIPPVHVLSPLALCLAVASGAPGCDHNPAEATSPITFAVIPDTAALEIDGSLQLTAEFDPPGHPTWRSSNPSVATVDTGGVVRGKAPGVVTVTAIAKGGSGISTITVIDFGAIIRGIRPRGFAAVPYTLLSASSSATMIYVSPSGSDSNPGTSAAPFRTINRAAQVARAGDVVTIRPGDYRESVIVRNSGTSQQRIVFQAEQRGSVVLTGGTYKFEPVGWTGGKLTSGPFYITVRGLIFRHYAAVSDTTNTGAAAKAATGWTYEDCLFDSAGRTALDIRGDSVTVIRSTFQYNYQHAFTTWGPTNGATGPDDPKFVGVRDLRIIDDVLRGNNAGNVILPAALSSRVAKLIATKGALVDNIESYENLGPGLWLDWDNTDYTIRNSYFHDNRGGLNLEADWSHGLVENNVSFHSDAEAIAVNNSQGVEVRYNLMADHAQCIRMYNVDRGSSHVLHNVHIHDNFCKNWSKNGAIQAWAGTYTAPEQMNVHLDGNAYDPGASDWLTWWPNIGPITTIEKVQTLLGWEMRGRMARIEWPR